MMTTRSAFRSTGLAVLGIVLSLVALGADKPPQKIDAGGLSFEAPGDWKSTRPSNPQMRRAQLSVAPVEGDKDPAELVVFAFPGGGGTAEDNIRRWQGFFRDDDGNLPRIESRVVKGQNVDVTRVETAGRYVAPVFPGSPKTHDKPGYRLLGGIVQTDQAGYFFRMIGPEKTVASARSGLDQLLTSIKVTEK
jgi:hypothetical protein